MFCHKCGKELVDGAEFCIYCGSSTQYNNRPGVTVPPVQKNPVRIRTSDKTKYKDLLLVLFPILTGSLALIGIMELFLHPSQRDSSLIFLCLGALFAAVEMVYIINEAKSQRLNKGYVVLAVLNFACLAAVTVSTFLGFRIYYVGPGRILISEPPYTAQYIINDIIIAVLSFTVVLSSGIFAVRSLKIGKKQFFYMTVALMLLFSVFVRLYRDYKADMAHDIEAAEAAERKQREKEREKEEKRKQEKEDEEKHRGEIRIVIDEEPSLDDEIESMFAPDWDEEYDSDKKSATVFGLLSAATLFLIVWEGLAICKRKKSEEQ